MAIEYKLMQDDGGDPRDCDSCDYPAPLAAFDPALLADSREPKLLCELCAGTAAGHALDYPSQYPNADVLKTICHVGNAILAELRKMPFIPRKAP
jgi:hypothetical protein